MKRKTTTSLAAVGLLASVLGTAGSAAATTRISTEYCEGVTIRAKVTAPDVRLQKGVRERQNIRVSLYPLDSGYSLDADTDNWVTTESYDESAWDSEMETLDSYVSDYGRGETYEATILPSNPSTGKHFVDLYASFDLYDENNDSTWCYITPKEAATFFTRLDTNLSFNASPEPVKKGAKAKMSGKLTRLKADQTGYRTYAGKTLKFYFDPKGSAGPSYKGSTTTRTDGSYTKYFTQNSSGTWKVVFTATSTYGGNSHTDYVAVS